MKMLWLCPEIPYPLTTGLLRVYSLLRELGQRHEITFVSITRRREVQPESLQALAPFTKRVIVHSEWDSPEPFLLRVLKKIPYVGARVEDGWRKRQVSRKASRTLRDLVREEEFDVLLFGGRYKIPGLKELGLPIVVDCCDAHCARFLGEMQCAPLLRRPPIYLRYLLMKRSETKMARMSRYVSFISDRDRKALARSAAHTQILPQGVDFNFWKRSSRERERGLLVFTGGLDYSPNDDAARFLMREILPLVKRAVPGVRTVIVGRDPMPQVLDAAANDPDITVTGFVPDVRPYLERAEIYVAPLRFSSGVQNKVLEAMAMELPVVTTPAVADALVWDGEHAPVLVAAGAREIAETVIGLLHDEEKREELGRRGREFVVEHCRWSHSASIFESMCAAAVSDRYSAGLDPSVHLEQCA